MTPSDGVTLDEYSRLQQAYPAVFSRTLVQRLQQPLLIVVTLVYIAFSVWLFDLVHVFGSANWTRFGIELSQWFSYDSRPDIAIVDNRLAVTFGRYDPLGPNAKPDWILQSDPTHVIVMWGSEDRRMEATPQVVTFKRGVEEARFLASDKGWVTQDQIPAWVTLQEGGAIASFGFAGNAILDMGSISIRRKFLGWANFFFDQDSRFANMPPGKVLALIASRTRLDPTQSNLALAWHDFLNNSDWQHGDVLISLLQTIVMAFVGTLFAAAMGAPLSFLAARTVMPWLPLNWGLKRLFDFLRCVDIFIWALFFTRGFGPGPLAGISAIFFTDTGTLGKTFTEALENIDHRPVEGVRSLGADPIQVQRYAMVPQVLPVFVSQALYQWESNTRSATVIGAMGAGGIGLKLLEAMRTHSNWANVAYMVLLILIVVYLFDNVSTWLRRKLIGTDR
jgi:phosphonate transport system permease protein